jgi:hypothetical protein
MTVANDDKKILCYPCPKHNAINEINGGEGKFP